MLHRLTNQITQWGRDRGILENSNAKDQFLKTVSEVGELADALSKGTQSEVEDAIGDIYVTLVMVAELRGTNMQTCIAGAYDEIKDRKGYLTPAGVFVKEDT